MVFSDLYVLIKDFFLLKLDNVYILQQIADLLISVDSSHEPLRIPNAYWNIVFVLIRQMVCT